MGPGLSVMHASNPRYSSGLRFLGPNNPRWSFVPRVRSSYRGHAKGAAHLNSPRSSEKGSPDGERAKLRQQEKTIRSLEGAIQVLAQSQDGGREQLRQFQEKLEQQRREYQEGVDHLETALENVSQVHSEALEQGTRDSQIRQANFSRIQELEAENCRIIARHDTHLGLAGRLIREQNAHERRRNDILEQMVDNDPELWKSFDPEEGFHPENFDPPAQELNRNFDLDA
jgi:hypothetical protein